MFYRDNLNVKWWWKKTLSPLESVPLELVFVLERNLEDLVKILTNLGESVPPTEIDAEWAKKVCALQKSTIDTLNGDITSLAAHLESQLEPAGGHRLEDIYPGKEVKILETETKIRDTNSQKYSSEAGDPKALYVNCIAFDVELGSESPGPVDANVCSETDSGMS